MTKKQYLFSFVLATLSFIAARSLEKIGVQRFYVDKASQFVKEDGYFDLEHPNSIVPLPMGNMPLSDLTLLDSTQMFCIQSSTGGVVIYDLDSNKISASLSLGIQEVIRDIVVVDSSLLLFDENMSVYRSYAPFDSLHTTQLTKGNTSWKSASICHHAMTHRLFIVGSVDNLEQTGIDSNYTATYYPWILVRDTVNNTQLYIPPTGEVCRNLALTDNIAFPWFATAGYTRGLVNAVKARVKLTQEARDTLYEGRINPIATFSDVGTVIWGNKTLQIRQSALDRINVRRLLLQSRKLISAVAIRLLFEQNDEQVRQDFLDSVNPILDSIRRDRGLVDFRVTVSNSPEDIDANQLVGKIYLKPTRALEFIDIEFLITPTGASFEDI